MRNKQGLYVGVANELSIAAETLFFALIPILTIVSHLHIVN
jgi:hypothetical protein